MTFGMTANDYGDRALATGRQQLTTDDEQRTTDR
jgi:hypothetical protein